MRAHALALALAFAVAACEPTYRVGDEVMVEWDGKEYQAVILAVEGPAKLKIHYDGYDDAWDEVVPKARVKGLKKGSEPRPEPPAKVRQKAVEAAQTNTYRIGDAVRVEWNGRFYAAQIVDIVGKEKYRVHYEGYGPEWDENVGLGRIQAK
jgi:hypothetical protein